MGFPCVSEPILSQVPIVMTNVTDQQIIPPLTGLVLAGGRGRRMDGADKGLVLYRGKPLINHVCKLLAPQVQHLLISANRNTEQYAQFGYPVVADLNDQYNGPLAGIYVGMHQAPTQYLLCVPCDMPALPNTLAEQLWYALATRDADVSIAYDGIRAQYLCVLLRTDLKQDLGRYLDAGQRAVQGWFKRLNTTLAYFPNGVHAFCNINTHQELAAFSKVQGT